MKTSRFLVPLFAFAGGALCGNLLLHATKAPAVSAENPQAAAAPSSPRSATTRIELAQEAAVSSKEETEPALRNDFRISSRTMDALLAGGDKRRMFSRMDLSEEQIKSIERIRLESMEKLKELEKRHAKVASRDGMEFVQVDSFPAERDAWLAGIARNIQTEIPDDRAEVVSRLLAAEDNDEQAGTARREIHVNPRGPEGKFRIEEKSFDAVGSHIDSDFEVVDSSTKSRWGHLLDFGASE